jgi:hypothetical protein
MSSELDVPNLPFKKPMPLERIEKLSFAQREAMDPYEIEERVQEAANSLAIAYREHKAEERDYDSCVVIIFSALTQTGQSLGGKMGATMVGMSDRAARRACHEAFPDESEM